ncbi:MAG TPA: FtsX-like permease family protein [bacterium]|nr:FtsX-like permease family protein [bacterium]
MRALLLALAIPTLRRRPWQAALAVLGIALGVAVVVGIDLAAAAALASFRGAVTAVAGNTTHEVAGAAGPLPEDLYRTLRTHPSVEAATPVVTDTAIVQEADYAPVRLLGIDAFSDFRFRAYSPTSQGTTTALAGTPHAATMFQRFITGPNTCLLARPFGQRHGIKDGDRITLQIGAAPQVFTVLALFDPVGPGADAAGELLLCDIATAQETTGRLGTLDRIDLILPGDGSRQDHAAETIRANLPPGVELRRPSQRSGQVEQLIAAFRLNLQALSLLALFVGVFLIYNTMLFAVVQRRRSIGIVRALGATRGEVLGAFLAEAGGLGVAGSAVGLALGTGLAQYAVQLVATTISDLYAYVRVDQAPLTAAATWKGILLGLGASVLATLGPAREAAATPPRTTWIRSELEGRTRASLPTFAVAGAVLLAAAWTMARWEAGGIPGGFGAAALVALGFACFTPHAVLGMERLLRGPAASVAHGLGTLAITNVGATLSRTGMAIAALMVALAMVVGVTTMIRSFRGTVRQWIGGTVVADLYINPAGQEMAGMGLVLDPGLVAELGQLEDVAALGTYRARELDFRGQPVALVAIDAPIVQRYAQFSFVEGRSEEVWPQVAQGAVLVSEPFARKFDVRRGDRILLPTPEGPREFTVAGVNYDYSADRGVVLFDRTVYARIFQDPAINSVALFLEDGVDPAAMMASLRARYETRYRLYVRSNRDIRETVFTIFDRTFAVTLVMQGLAAGVAFAGVLSALLSLLLERTREFGILRAVGAPWGELVQMLALETAFMGLVASLLACLCGIAISWVLVAVINLRSFGWTIPLALEWDTFAQALGIAIGASLLAGVWPALRLRQMVTAQAVREE